MDSERPICPDLSGDVPRCVATCPRRDDHEEVATLCGVSAVIPIRLCRSDGDKEIVYDRDVCLPYTRHLKLLSERRCDGCASYRKDEPGQPLCFSHCILTYPHEYCSRWSPKTNQTPAAVSDGEKREE